MVLYEFICFYSYLRPPHRRHVARTALDVAIFCWPNSWTSWTDPTLPGLRTSTTSAAPPTLVPGQHPPGPHHRDFVHPPLFAVTDSAFAASNELWASTSGTSHCDVLGSPSTYSLTPILVHFEYIHFHRNRHQLFPRLQNRHRPFPLTPGLFPLRHHLQALHRHLHRLRHKRTPLKLTATKMKADLNKILDSCLSQFTSAL